MSKVSATANDAIGRAFASKQSAVGHAEFVLTGKRTLTRKEAEKLFGDAADVLDVEFNRIENNMRAIIAAEIEVADATKMMISRAKNLAAQVGDSMARIDKIVVKDFDAKLSQLERFVAAMQALDELKKSGRLDVLMNGLIK